MAEANGGRSQWWPKSMVAEVNGGIATDEPEFSGDCGSASEVSKTAFLDPAFLEPVFSKPVFWKQLKKNQNL
ncbi:MAG: hypothetical protein RIS56_1080 [Verrucomicrobiota bacterium]